MMEDDFASFAIFEATRFLLDATALVEVDLGEAPLPMRLTLLLFLSTLRSSRARRHHTSTLRSDAISPGLPGHPAHRSLVSEL
jgi:hypothetical protein